MKQQQRSRPLRGHETRNLCEWSLWNPVATSTILQYNEDYVLRTISNKIVENKYMTSDLWVHFIFKSKCGSCGWHFASSLPFFPWHLMVRTSAQSVCEGCDKLYEHIGTQRQASLGARGCHQRGSQVQIRGCELSRGGGRENVCGRGRTRVEGRDKSWGGSLREEETRTHVGSMSWIAGRLFKTDAPAVVFHWHVVANKNVLKEGKKTKKTDVAAGH